jgi:hypothetical protein
LRVINVTPGYDSAVGLGLARDGGVVLGVHAVSGGPDPHVVKLTARGKNDPSFGGGDGMVSNFADGFTLVDIGIRSDGRILGMTDGDASIASFLVSRRGVLTGGYGLVITTLTAELEAMYVDAKSRPVITGREGGEASVLRLQAEVPLPDRQAFLGDQAFHRHPHRGVVRVLGEPCPAVGDRGGDLVRRRRVAHLCQQDVSVHRSC